MVQGLGKKCMQIDTQTKVLFKDYLPLQNKSPRQRFECMSRPLSCNGFPDMVAVYFGRVFRKGAIISRRGIRGKLCRAWDLRDYG